MLNMNGKMMNDEHLEHKKDISNNFDLDLCLVIFFVKKRSRSKGGF